MISFKPGLKSRIPGTILKNLWNLITSIPRTEELTKHILFQSDPNFNHR